MIYDFIGKIRNVKNEALLDLDALGVEIDKIAAKALKPLEIRVILSEKEPRRDLLIKTKISVSSFSNVHMEDLNSAIQLFRHYLNEIATVSKGDISYSEGFYNNDKTYSPLY